MPYVVKTEATLIGKNSRTPVVLITINNMLELETANLSLVREEETQKI